MSRRRKIVDTGECDGAYCTIFGEHFRMLIPSGTARFIAENLAEAGLTGIFSVVRLQKSFLMDREGFQPIRHNRQSVVIGVRNGSKESSGAYHLSCEEIFPIDIFNQLTLPKGQGEKVNRDKILDSARPVEIAAIIPELPDDIEEPKSEVPVSLDEEARDPLSETENVQPVQTGAKVNFCQLFADEAYVIDALSLMIRKSIAGRFIERGIVVEAMIETAGLPFTIENRRATGSPSVYIFRKKKQELLIPVRGKGLKSEQIILGFLFHERAVSLLEKEGFFVPEHLRVQETPFLPPDPAKDVEVTKATLADHFSALEKMIQNKSAEIRLRIREIDLRGEKLQAEILVLDTERSTLLSLYQVIQERMSTLYDLGELLTESPPK